MGTALLLLGACQGGVVSDSIDPHIVEALETIRAHKVFFGHQSVGRNVLQGIRELGTLAGVDLPSGAVEDGVSAAELCLVDAHVGTNTRPYEKIDEFTELMRSGLARDVDIAFMKFCYVDANSGFSAEEIFHAYVTAMESLESEFPETTFVYLTMPLTATRTDVRGLIKRVLGMETRGREDNIERNRFNDLLRERKGGDGRLFDIAAAEYTHPDGSIETFKRNGRTYRAMVPAYSDDGGHLNERGRRVVAEQLIVYLANLARSQSI